MTQMTHMTQITLMTTMTAIATITVTMTLLQHNVTFLAKYGWSKADFWTRVTVSRLFTHVMENGVTSC